MKAPLLNLLLLLERMPLLSLAITVLLVGSLTFCLWQARLNLTHSKVRATFALLASMGPLLVLALLTLWLIAPPDY